ncbi:hypothetical protein NCLIV_016050 [Neospora caninum Liverpool]|uniref:RNA recognition motif protein n=1 Tax=Neospora caninum (strain Liverpool) TaxID=572307 RepID=F0VDM0_NEOCL|nr:hypothetical protein NCLIV_016050 [Neospora caninum Liverpool]CBZ51813.1 hypothetical protein NCLIV_016050 [Neospora caninum Liverpool]CEL65771.1 TPA: hypothetical protein BN1204_016050 [Neospora caninum Liverpool]|eukprot:XP_003881846.1 hypothetical protein NCLIV_016050 [Neospora caninum Liverpool]
MRASKKGRGVQEDANRQPANSPASSPASSLASPSAGAGPATMPEDVAGKTASASGASKGKQKASAASGKQSAASAGAQGSGKGRRGSAEEEARGGGSAGASRDAESKLQAKAGTKRSSSMSAREDPGGSASAPSLPSSGRRSASGEEKTQKGAATKKSPVKADKGKAEKKEGRGQIPAGGQKASGVKDGGDTSAAGKGEKGGPQDEKGADASSRKKGPTDANRKRGSSAEVAAVKGEEDALRTTSEDESSKKACLGRTRVAACANERTASRRAGRDEHSEAGSRPASGSAASWGGSARVTPVGADDEREETETCPLCLEDMDETDRGLFPCECGYQLCLWCLHHIRERLGNKCPACRREYDEKKFKFNEERVNEGKRLAGRQRGAREKQPQQSQSAPLLPSFSSSLPSHASHVSATQAGRSGAAGATSASAAWAANQVPAALPAASTSHCQASHASPAGAGVSAKAAAGADRPSGVGSPSSAAALKDVRVIQRSLVYVIGIPSSIAKKEILKRTEFFGQYGKVLHIVINKAQGYNSAWGGPSYAVYVTYSTVPEAIAAIQSIDGAVYEGRTLKASFGTTKYCSYFLKGIKCQNPDCFYLHYLGSDKDSFTKEAMISAKHQFLDLTLPTDEAKKGSASGSGPGALASRSASPPAFGFPAVSAADASLGDKGAVKTFGFLSPGSVSDERKQAFGEKGGANKESPRTGEALLSAEGSGDVLPEHGTPSSSSCKRRRSARGEKAGNARSSSVSGSGPETDSAAVEALGLGSVKGRPQHGGAVADPKTRREAPAASSRVGEKGGTSWASVAAGGLKASLGTASKGVVSAPHVGPAPVAKARATAPLPASGEPRPDEDEKKKGEKGEGFSKRQATAGSKKEDEKALEKVDVESRRAPASGEKKKGDKGDSGAPDEKGKEGEGGDGEKGHDAKKRGEEGTEGLLSPPKHATRGAPSDARDEKSARSRDRGRRRSTQSVSSSEGGTGLEGEKEAPSEAEAPIASSVASAAGSSREGRRLSTETPGSGSAPEKPQWSEASLAASFQETDAPGSAGAGTGDSGPLLRSGEIPKRDGGRGKRDTGGPLGPSHGAPVFPSSSHFPALSVASSYAAARPPASSGIPTPPPLHAPTALPLPPYHHGSVSEIFASRPGTVPLPPRAGGPSRGPASGAHLSGSVASSACASPATFHSCYPSSPYQVFSYGGPLPPSAALPSSFSLVASGGAPGLHDRDRAGLPGPAAAGAASGTSSFSSFSPGIVGARPLAHMSSFASALAAQQPPLLPLPPSAYPQAAGRDVGAASWSPGLFFSLAHRGASPETDAPGACANASSGATASASSSASAHANSGSSPVAGSASSSETSRAQNAGGTTPGEGARGPAVSGDGASAPVESGGAGDSGCADKRDEAGRGKGDRVEVEARTGSPSFPYAAFPPLSFTATRSSAGGPAAGSEAGTKGPGDSAAVAGRSAHVGGAAAPSEEGKRETEPAPGGDAEATGTRDGERREGEKAEEARGREKEDEEFFDVPGLDDILGQMVPGMPPGDSLLGGGDADGTAPRSDASFFRPFASFHSPVATLEPSRVRPQDEPGASSRKREDRDGAPPFGGGRAQSLLPSSLSTLLPEPREDERRNGGFSDAFFSAFPTSLFASKDVLPVAGFSDAADANPPHRPLGRLGREDPASADAARFDAFHPALGYGRDRRDGRGESDRDGLASSSPFFASLLAKKASGAYDEQGADPTGFPPSLRESAFAGRFASRDALKTAEFAAHARGNRQGEARASQAFVETQEDRSLLPGEASGAASLFHRDDAGKHRGRNSEREGTGASQAGQEDGRAFFFAFPSAGGRKEKDREALAGASGEELGARAADPSLRPYSSSLSGSSSASHVQEFSGRHDGSVFRPFNAPSLAAPRLGAASVASSSRPEEAFGASSGAPRGEASTSSLSFLSRFSQQRHKYPYVPTSLPFARGGYAADGDSEMTFGPGVGVSPLADHTAPFLPLHSSGASLNREREAKEGERREDASVFAALTGTDLKHRRASEVHTEEREPEARGSRPGQGAGGPGGYSGHQLLLHLQQQHAKILQAKRSAAGLAGQETLEGASGASRPSERRKEDDAARARVLAQKMQTPSSFFPKLSEKWAGRGEENARLRSSSSAVDFEKREGTLPLVAELPAQRALASAAAVREASACAPVQCTSYPGEASEANSHATPGAAGAAGASNPSSARLNNNALAVLLSLLPNANVSIVGPDGSASSTFCARSRNNSVTSSTSLASASVLSTARQRASFASLAMQEPREGLEGEKPAPACARSLASASAGAALPGVLGADPAALGRRVSEGEGTERTEKEKSSKEEVRTETASDGASAAFPLSPSAFPPLSSSHTTGKRSSAASAVSAPSGGSATARSVDSSASGALRSSADSVLRRPASGGSTYSSLSAAKRPGLLPSGRAPQVGSAGEKPSVFSAFSSFSSSSFLSPFSSSTFSPFSSTPGPHTFGAVREETGGLKGEKKDRAREKAARGSGDGAPGSAETLAARRGTDEEKGDRGDNALAAAGRRSSGVAPATERVDTEKTLDKSRGEEREEGERGDKEREGTSDREGKKPAGKENEDEKRRENSPGTGRKKKDKEDRRYSDGSKNGALAPQANRPGAKEGRQRTRHR